MSPASFLLEGGLLLGALALNGMLFRWLNLSAIPAFILLGLLLHPFVGESRLVEIFAILGVVLLLFFMGLEFSFRALIEDHRKIVAYGARDLAINFPVGFIAGLLLGWGILGALILAGAFYISSSAIVAKTVIDLRRTAYPETEAALGILVFEDVAIALLLALLSGVVLSGGTLTAGVAGVGRAVLFFGAVGVLGRYGRPVLNRMLNTEDDDLFILATGAILLLVSWVAVLNGLSEAIGAFVAGTLLAETDHRQRIEERFAPLQGIFAALFFLAFGLSIDPWTFADVWLPALLLSVLAVATKMATGWWAGRTAGFTPRASFSLGVTLLPRGEFSVVLAGLAVAAGFPRAPALVALMVLVLSVVGTAAIRWAPNLSSRLFTDEGGPDLEARGFRPDLAGGDE